MTAEQISAATGSSLKRATLFLPYIEETCSRYDISSPVRQLCFLSQVGHESGGLLYTEELATGKAYEGRKDLGNVHKGDGVKYKGRGLIQITGKTNYTTLSRTFNVDFVNIPGFLGAKTSNLCSPTQLKYATLSAGWYWDARDLNAYTDVIDIHSSIDVGTNLTAFKTITKKINGGYNGLQDRLSKYHSGLKCFS